MVATQEASPGRDEAALLEVVGIARSYGARSAVEDLSFSLRRGEVFGLLGVNGAGKTTSLRMICGTLAPSRGKVLIAGVDLFEAPREAKARIGFLPEVPPLDGEARVAEFLDFAAALHRVPRSDRPSAVERALERCGLDEVRHRLIRNLSKGYQQRVGIAQALVHNPDLIVLDEPTVGLDPLQVREIRRLIADLRRDHAVVLSSHILPEIQAVCDRVLILHRGRMAYSDRLEANEERDGRVYGVTFARPPEAGRLAAVDGVREAQDLGSGRFAVTLNAVEALDRLQAAAVAEDWGVRELAARRPNLETIFTQVTAGQDQ